MECVPDDCMKSSPQSSVFLFLFLHKDHFISDQTLSHIESPQGEKQTFTHTHTYTHCYSLQSMMSPSLQDPRPPSLSQYCFLPQCVSKGFTLLTRCVFFLSPPSYPLHLHHQFVLVSLSLSSSRLVFFSCLFKQNAKNVSSKHFL